MVEIRFNAQSIEPSVNFEPIPDGTYTCEITNTELKTTRSGENQYLNIEFTVLEGAYRGRKVWDRLNLYHSNEITRQISERNLSAICHAVGCEQLEDTVQLHNIPLKITVRARKMDSGDFINVIRGYAAFDRVMPSVPVEQVDLSVPPWQRG